jgi:hypothetical protein
VYGYVCVCVCVCVFFPQIFFWCSQTGDHQQEDLPKLAILTKYEKYIYKKRVIILLYFGYLLEMIIEIWQLIIIMIIS